MVAWLVVAVMYVLHQDFWFWRTARRGRGDRHGHGRIPRGGRIDAGVAGVGAAPDARARVAALLPQLYVHPAVLDRVSAHRHLLSHGAAARTILPSFFTKIQ